MMRVPPQFADITVLLLLNLTQSIVKNVLLEFMISWYVHRPIGMEDLINTKALYFSIWFCFFQLFLMDAKGIIVADACGHMLEFLMIIISFYWLMDIP